MGKHRRQQSLQLICAVLTLGIGVCAAGGPKNFAAESLKRASPVIFAHRSCFSAEVPENSLRGLDICLKNGMQIMEIDIHRTKDDVLVLMHDDTLDRTTSLTGRVDQMTYAQLKAARLRVGAGGPDAALTSEKILTLAEALRRVRGKSILFLDYKIREPRDITDILDVVTREKAQEHVAMYPFPNQSVQDYAKLPEWVPRHFIVPVVEPDSFPNRDAVQPTIAAAVEKYESLKPLAYMVFSKNPSYWTTRPQAPVILLAAPIYGLAGDHDEGDEATVADPGQVWGARLDAGAGGFMTNHPLQLQYYAKQRNVSTMTGDDRK